LSVLLPLVPHPFVDVSVGVLHLPRSVFHIISPLSLVDVAV
jgi:hypothetical protein